MQATSPIDPIVLNAMLPYYLTSYDNPHSLTHLYGWESDEAIETTRFMLASLINASPKEIVFTSCATESNNISVKGVVHFYNKDKDKKKKHVITTQMEHKCVLNSCRHHQQEGFNAMYLPMRRDEMIDLDKFKASIHPDTTLVSVMIVSNEIGMIQPMEESGHICKEHIISFHMDVTQALGKI